MHAIQEPLPLLDESRREEDAQRAHGDDGAARDLACDACHDDGDPELERLACLTRTELRALFR